MKVTKKFVKAFLLIVIAALMSRFSCGPDEPKISQQDKVKAELIANTWKLQSVTVDGTDKTSVYKDLSLKFSATGFTSTNGGVIWPTTGTWTFTSEDATAVRRDDGTEVQLIEITDTSLKLGMTWTKTTLGRVESVSGQHVFTFGK